MPVPLPVLESAALPEPAPARQPAPVPAPVDAAAREQALLAYADSIILGRPMPPRPAPRAALPQDPWAAPVSAEPEDAAPTFHVTIGTLEVVAAPVAGKRPQRKRPAPRLSLQDYLDRRRVGR